jgi:D-alanyl-D-alanine carboxypeptidase
VARLPSRLLSLVVLVLVASGCAGSRSDDGRLTEGQRPELQRLLERVRSAGAPGAIAIARGSSGTWSAATGNAVVKPRRTMRVEDRIRIASITKSFVATVVLQLVNEGRLSLDDTVEQRLPGVLRFGRQITVRQLLNHTSGFASGDGDFPESEALYREFLSDVRFDVPVRKRIALADGRPLHFQPGTNFHYTNSGYDVLGLIVERVTGDPLGDALAERIFEPLELRHTSFEPQPLPPDAEVAHGYAIEGSDLAIANWAGPQDVTGASLLGTWASAGIVSSVQDLATFYGALLGGDLLPRPLLNEMEQTVRIGSPLVRAGFGIFRYKLPCAGYAWGHGGSTLGYSSMALASKDGSHVVAVGANAFASGAFYELVEKTARDLYCNT